MGRGKHSFLNDGDEHVGVDIPANPLSFVGARQHAQDFPGLPASLLASTSPQSRCPPLGHANMFRIFPTCWRLCWRRPPRKPFVFRWGTPTRFRLFRSAGVIVGVDLPAKPLSYVGARQHAQDFPGLPGLLLASTSPQSLYPTSDHANMKWIFPASWHHCWRRPPRKAFVLRRDTPTWFRLFRSAGVIVGVNLSAKPLSYVGSRQHDSDYLNLPVLKNERTCIRKAISA